MKTNSLIRGFKASIVSLLLTASLSAVESKVVDTFDHEHVNTLGAARMFLDDSSLGGKSTYQTVFEDGVLDVEGKLVPARGQPGFVSMVLLLEATGQPVDLSEYTGIKLKIRVKKGAVSVLAACSEITNFDFHAQPIRRGKGGIQEVIVPFESMKRVWSEQIPLNTTTIGSINLVASGLQPGDFAYEIDEISLY